MTKRELSPSQVQAFRELASKISGPDSSQKFEDALRVLLQAKCKPKRRTRRAKDTVRADEPITVQAVGARATR